MAEISLTDFRMAGFLVARGQKVLRTDRNHSQEVVFIFGNREEVMALISEFPGSPEQVYDSACKTMHNLVKLTQRRQGGRGRG